MIWEKSGRFALKFALMLILPLVFVSSSNAANAKTVKLEKLNVAQTQFLDKYGFVITNKEFKQIFEPYIRTDEPLFITSDSVINAYNVLFEDSYCQFEKMNASALPVILRYLWNNLENTNRHPENSKALLKPAKRRAQIVIGTALVLLGDDTISPDSEIKEIIINEAALVRKAEGIKAPSWIKTDSSFMGIDYSNFKPVGFYTKNQKLSDYYRALKWLQTIPFRVDNDLEAASILILGDCIFSDYIPDEKQSPQDKKTSVMIEKFFRHNREFSGVEDNPDLYLAGRISSGCSMSDNAFQSLKRFREDLPGKIRKPQVNDLISYKPVKGVEVANFRIFSPVKLPDTVLFQKMMNSGILKNGFPSGYMVGAAVGSVCGMGIVLSEYGDKSDKVFAMIRDVKPLFGNRSLYCDYLKCLGLLFKQPDVDAPYFMKNEKWRIKDLQTFLCGWSLIRHTFVLSSKLGICYAGMCDTPPGFVEPVPEFYSGLANLTRKTRLLLKESGAFSGEMNRIEIAYQLREYADLLRLKEDELSDENDSYSKKEMLAMHFNQLFDVEPGGVAGRKIDPADVEKIADKIEKNDEYFLSLNPEIRDTLIFNHEEYWDELEYICRKLESLSYRQLKKQGFNAEEQQFIKDYGTMIARIMFYEGNSYLSPNDDAPKTVFVCSDPNSKDRKYLQAATGRPCAIYVLYPHNGKKILCKGAVMSYHEYFSSEPLTDQEWKKKLSEKQAKTKPYWINDIVR